jgi:uncharacterized protein (PEP-CTERM system associated)
VTGRRSGLPASVQRRLQTGTLLSLLLAGICSVQAQGLRVPGTMPVPGSSTVAPDPLAPPAVPGMPEPLPPLGTPGAVPAAPPAGVQPPGGSAPVRGLERGLGQPVEGNPLVAPRVSRTTFLEGELITRATGTDRGRLDRESGKDLILGVSPRLSMRTRGARVRLDATVGFDHVRYIKHTDEDYTQPRVNLAAQTTLVDNLLFLDGGIDIDRRAESPYSVQTADVPSEEQVETSIYRLSPRLEQRRPSGWNTLLRSDNIWARRSYSQVPSTGQEGDSYSQSTLARIERQPEPFGFGLEGGRELLRYQDQDDDVVRIENARASVSMAVTPQVTTWLLGGAERSHFLGRSQTDSDFGVRVRWAPLERSVFDAEVRKRFFGTGFNAQWNHRHRNFGLTLSGSREPLTQPEAVQLSGNIGEQFDAMFRSRGYTPSQREALVRAALEAYGLPANLADPVGLHVNRPQLSTTASGMLSIMGRRSVFVLSAYYRKLVQLRRDGDIEVPGVQGDRRQYGGQLSATFRVTPLSSLDASWRFDDSRGIGADAMRASRDQVFSIGTSHAMSPRTRVNLSVQHHVLETAEPSRPSSASANSATLGLHYRF